MDKSTLIAKALRYQYGDTPAVQDLSFSLSTGEIVALLGPNGAGKTTTMRMVTGFLPPRSGHITIAGHDTIDDAMQARALVGYMPERVPVYPDMTVRGYVQFFARLRGLRNSGQRADAVLRRFDLYTRRDALVRSLSKGLRQRLGLCQALVHDPPVLVLDEPTIGIDPQQVIEVRQAIRDLRGAHAVLFSTHLLREAEEMCDRVLILNRGKLAAQGTPAALARELRANRYYVAIGAEETQALRVLREIPGVTSITREGEGYHVDAAGTADLRPQLSQAVVHAGLTLLEIRQVRGSLEQIFLDAVTEDRR